jgi:hypothetical protein
MATEERDRQFQIREGAGLEESRLNQDFIEFLRKWSTPLLVVIAVVAVSYAIFTRWKEAEYRRHDQAFADFQQVSGVENPSPDSLKRFAVDAENIGGLSLMARLQAADAYMRAVRLGVKPGATLTPKGELANKDDVMTAEERAANLASAEELYKRVIADADRNTAQILMVAGSMYGLASIAESREDFDAARAQYESIDQLLKGGAYDTHARIARRRIESLDSIKTPARLFAKSDLPASALAPPSPWDQPPVPQPTAPVPTPVDVAPVGPAVPGPEVPPAPAGGEQPQAEPESKPEPGSAGEPKQDAAPDPAPAGGNPK